MRKVILAIAASMTLWIGCSKTEPRTEISIGGNATENSTTTNRYKTRGVVKEFEGPMRAKIAHEDIPGYMAAMTMPLEVKNANEYAGIKVGDQITFDMVVTKEDGWIENVKRIGQAAVPVGDTNAT